MNKPSFFQKLYLPFFSADYYRHVVKSTKGFGLKTFFGVLTVNWLITLLIITIGFLRVIGDAEFNAVKNDLIKQFPVITIQDGKASISEPTPYVIAIPDSKVPLIVFATSEQDQITEEMEHAYVLVTQDEIVVHKSSTETRSYKIAEIQNATFDGVAVEGFVYSVLLIAIPMMLVLFIGGSFLFRLLQVFVLAAVGQIFNAIFQTQLVYDQMCRLTCAALTPVLLLDIGVFYVWGGPKLWFFNFCLAMIFLGFGVSSQKQNGSEPVSVG